VVCVLFAAAAMAGTGAVHLDPNYLASPVSEGGRGLGVLSSTTWIVILQAGAAVGFVSFGYVADRVGRKIAFIAYFVLAALCVPVFVLVDGRRRRRPAKTRRRVTRGSRRGTGCRALPTPDDGAGWGARRSRSRYSADATLTLGLLAVKDDSFGLRPFRGRPVRPSRQPHKEDPCP
jgi:hypothetical protein